MRSDNVEVYGPATAVEGTGANGLVKKPVKGGQKSALQHRLRVWSSRTNF
jgi:hypothetical protein